MIELVFKTGKDFELYVFGVTSEIVEGYHPSNYGLKANLSSTVNDNWQRFAEWKEGKCSWHDPSSPTMGQTKVLWDAVKKHLPKRISGKMPQLNLYISVGVNSLDRSYGVDAFFWWQGASVTFDASLRPKDKLGTLKADFLLKPEDFKKEDMEVWGSKVAQLLRQRSVRSRPREKGNRKRKKAPAFLKIYDSECE